MGARTAGAVATAGRAGGRGSARERGRIGVSAETNVRGWTGMAVNGGKVAAIVLAAGGSSRLGRPKQLVRIGSETLLERAVRVAREAGCAPVIVVVGAGAEQIVKQTWLGDAVAVRNEAWEQGMASSIRTGLAGVPAGASGVVLMVCDQPAVHASHLRLLMGAPERVRASRYAGRNGVPAYFPASAFERLRGLEGDAGARELLRDAEGVELPGGEIDIDTSEDVARLQDLVE